MKRILVATEGVGEYRAFPALAGQLTGGGAQIVKTVKVGNSPDASPVKMAKSCSQFFVIAQAKSANKFVLVLDREQRSQSCSDIALGVASELKKLAPKGIDVTVVIKDRAFENWLIADLAAFRAQGKRFSVAPATVRSVEPDKADRVDALGVLKGITVGGKYDKIVDTERTVKHYSVLRAAKHSRSLRHFLHELNHPSYATQCKHP